MNRMRKSSSSGTPKKAEARPPSTVFYEELFNRFKEKEEESIGPGGVEELCKALEVDPSDVLMLVMAWCLGASQMGYFSRQEWQSGLRKLGSVTADAELKERLEELHKSTLRDPEGLRELHIYAHKFCREERKKNIDVRSAVGRPGDFCLQLHRTLAPPPQTQPRGARARASGGLPASRHSLTCWCPATGDECADHADDAAQADVR